MGSLCPVLWSLERYAGVKAGVEQMSSQIIEFREYRCKVKRGLYGNGRRALSLVDAETGEPILTATVNLPDEKIETHQAFIKDYSENEGILAVLVAAKLVRDLGLKKKTGYVEVSLVDVL